MAHENKRLKRKSAYVAFDDYLLTLIAAITSNHLPMSFWFSGRTLILTILNVRVRNFIKIFMRLIYNPPSIIK